MPQLRLPTPLLGIVTALFIVFGIETVLFVLFTMVPSSMFGDAIAHAMIDLAIRYNVAVPKLIMYASPLYIATAWILGVALRTLRDGKFPLGRPLVPMSPALCLMLFSVLTLLLFASDITPVREYLSGLVKAIAERLMTLAPEYLAPGVLGAIVAYSVILWLTARYFTPVLEKLPLWMGACACTLSAMVLGMLSIQLYNFIMEGIAQVAPDLVTLINIIVGLLAAIEIQDILRTTKDETALFQLPVLFMALKGLLEVLAPQILMMYYVILLLYVLAGIVIGMLRRKLLFAVCICIGSFAVSA